MDLIGKTPGAATPAKDAKFNRSKVDESSRHSENVNPNMSSPGLKVSTTSPSVKSASKSQKSVTKKCNPSTNPVASPPIKNKIRERKFVVAKKNSKREKVNSSTTVVCKCNNKADGKSFKCLCVAYESLRASQEEFFKNRGTPVHEDENEMKKCDGAEIGVEEEEENEDPMVRNPDVVNGCQDKVEFDRCSEISRLDEKHDQDQNEGAGEIVISSSHVKRRRDKLMEVARENVPESGSGRVMHLVKAFENLLSIQKSKDPEEKDEKEIEDAKKGMIWTLPGLQPTVDPETQISSSSFCPSDFFLTSESLGLDSRLSSSSLDSSQGSFSMSSRTSGGGRRSRRNSAESSGTFARRHWKRKQLRATSQKPFKLRTEQRGRSKEEEFVKKVQQMMEEAERLRIPLAQGLPWTTDQPECLAKPPVKEITRPIDLVLHSDVRAVERAEFDNQVAEKMNLIEQYRTERERQQKLAEEEEIRRLRKDLVPKAQPMPYFDRPFMPRRSMKNPTIPREPKFHMPHHKKIKSCMSWNDFCTEQQ